MLRFALFVLSLAMLTGGALAAQSAIQITRSVYVERHVDGARVLEPAGELRRGDKVVLVTRWDGEDEARRITLASTVPPTLAFQRSGLDPHAVSIDGGENWGQLGEMRRGDRDAVPEDVTNLRWRVPARGGTLTYSAIVR